MKHLYKQRHGLLAAALIASAALWAGIPQESPAQDSEVGYTRGTTPLEDILPASPEPASAVRYADVPFTHSLGLAEYAVPVYELAGRQLHIPIRLLYRSGGVRVDEVGGVAGLGWTLEAGGCVTREVVYMPDEFQSRFSAGAFYRMPTEGELSALGSDPHPEAGPGWTLLRQISKGQRDCSPDRYSYNVCGLSGTFIMDASRTPVPITGDDGVLIAYDAASDTFTLTGPDGTIYTLGGNDADGHSAREYSTRRAQPLENPTPSSGQQEDWTAVTAWHLTRVESRDGFESATFTYADGGTWTRDALSKTDNITVAPAPETAGQYRATVGARGSSRVQSDCLVRVLSGIDLGGAHATFTYAAENSRALHRMNEGEQAVRNHPARLTAIEVSEAGTQRLRMVVGTQRDAFDGRVLLRGLTAYRGGVLDDRWTFGYYTAADVGVTRSSISHYSQDWYGYYNAENDLHGVPVSEGSLDPGTENTQGPDGGEGGGTSGGSTAQERRSLCPYDVVSDPLPAVRLRYGLPDASRAAYMMLRSADHDGALTQWSYEGNKIAQEVTVDGTQHDTLSIGVRVSFITVSDGTAPVHVRRFDYALPRVTGMPMPQLSSYMNVSASQVSLGVNGISGWPVGVGYVFGYTLHEGPVGDGLTLAGAGVTYGRVSETVTAPDEPDGARDVYFYDTTPLQAPYHDHEGVFPSQWSSAYITRCGLNPRQGVRRGYFEQNAGRTALLTRHERYARTGGSYVLKEYEETEYTQTGTSPVMTGYRVQMVMDPGGASGATGTADGDDCIHYPVYTARYYGRVPKTVRRVRCHAPLPGGGNADDSTVVRYAYVGRAQLSDPIRLRSVTSTGSDGGRTQSFQYADDLTGEPWATLASEHMLSVQVRKSWGHSSLPSATGGQPTVSGGVIPRPGAGGSLEEGGLLPGTGGGGTDTDAARTLETVYGLFGECWLPASIVETTGGVESWRADILERDAAGNIRTVKERGKPVTSIVWGYGGRYPVAVLEGADAQQAAAAMPQAMTASLLGSAGAPSPTVLTRLRNLRSYLPDAQVTVLLWAPGLGLSERTDPSGVRTVYAYDTGGRLCAVKDADGRTMEAWEYALLADGNARRSVRHRVYRDASGSTFSLDALWWNSLGMTLQEIAAGGAGYGADLVTVHEGDFLLHDDVRVWDPVPIPVTGGSYCPSAKMLAAPQAFTLHQWEQSSRNREEAVFMQGYAGTSHGTCNGEDSHAGLPVLAWEDGTGIVERGTWRRGELRCDWVQDPDGCVQAKVTDAQGRVLATERRLPRESSSQGGDAGAQRTVYVYDALDRLRAVAGPGIALTDTLSMWRYTYDAMGRVHSKGVPGAGSERYTYDEEDRVVAVDRADGSRTETEYDAFGRIVKVWASGGAMAARTLMEQHWWDVYPAEAQGIVTAEDPSVPAALFDRAVNGLETMVLRREVNGDGQPASGAVRSVTLYDARCRAVRTVTDWGGGSMTSTRTSYRFDDLPEQVETRSATAAGVLHTMTAEYSYDIRGRVRTEVSTLREGTVQDGALTVVSRDTTTYAFDQQGRPSGRTSRCGVRSVQMTDTYTLQGWLASRTWRRDGASLYTERLRYDSGIATGVPGRYSGLIAEREDTWSGPLLGTMSPVRTEGYRYDASARLAGTVSFQSQDGSPVAGQVMSGETFTHDGRGNILTLSRVQGEATLPGTQVWHYDGDRLSSVNTGQYQRVTSSSGTASATALQEAVSPTGERPSPGGPQPSLIQEIVWTFAHDTLGRMTADGQAGLEIAYNHLDLPRKITRNGYILAKYSYLSDGSGTEVLRADGSGLVRRGLFTYRKYPDGSLVFEGADFCAGRMTCGEVLYDVTDHLGSVRSVVRSGSSTPMTYDEYGVYGARTRMPLATPTSPEPSLRRGFTGKEDQQTEFGVPYTDFGARHYSPALRRWMVPDPLSEKYYGLSPYAYCNADPVNLVDPDGLDLVLRGSNESCFTISTDLFDLEFDLSGYDIDFGGTFTVAGDDVLTSALDIIGTFDPTGVADMLNTSQQFKQGNYSGALLSAISIFPGGDIVKVGKLAKDFRTLANAVDGATPALRKFTRGNFKINFERKYGIKVGPGQEVHHTLPCKFEDKFKKAGLEIHDPVHGQVVNSSLHRHESYSYNKEWEGFWEGRIPENTPIQEILDFRNSLLDRMSD
ncbi:MAG: hypothetical protein IJ652_01185 [Bacteroidales bacterium]|nr:hypothetical protein [Bacteroidales bacterium]